MLAVVWSNVMRNISDETKIYHDYRNKFLVKQDLKRTWQGCLMTKFVYLIVQKIQMTKQSAAFLQKNLYYKLMEHNENTQQQNP